MRVAVFTAALGVAAALASPATAQATPPAARETRLGPISRCMAYYAVVGGMDGTKAVDSNIAAVVKDLGTELYLEGARQKVDEQTLQNSVVAALVSINMSAKEEGMGKLKAAMEAECESLVDQVRGMD